MKRPLDGSSTASAPEISMSDTGIPRSVTLTARTLAAGLFALSAMNVWNSGAAPLIEGAMSAQEAFLNSGRPISGLLLAIAAFTGTFLYGRSKSAESSKSGGAQSFDYLPPYMS